MDFGASLAVSVGGAIAGGALVGWAEGGLGVRGVVAAAMVCNAAPYAPFAHDRGCGGR